MVDDIAAKLPDAHLNLDRLAAVPDAMSAKAGALRPPGEAQDLLR
jgi:hypothetical protein